MAAGRDAHFTCVVNNLEGHKVISDLIIGLKSEDNNTISLFTLNVVDKSQMTNILNFYQFRVIFAYQPSSSFGLYSQ